MEDRAIIGEKNYKRRETMIATIMTTTIIIAYLGLIIWCSKK